LSREWMAGKPGITNVLRFVSLYSPVGRLQRLSCCREVRS